MKVLQYIIPTFFGQWINRKSLFDATRPLVSLYVFLLVFFEFFFLWQYALDSRDDSGVMFRGGFCQHSNFQRLPWSRARYNERQEFCVAECRVAVWLLAFNKFSRDRTIDICFKDQPENRNFLHNNLGIRHIVFISSKIVYCAKYNRCSVRQLAGVLRSYALRRAELQRSIIFSFHPAFCHYLCPRGY